MEIKDLWVFVRKIEKKEVIAIINVDNVPTPMIYHDKKEMKQARRMVRTLPGDLSKGIIVRHFAYAGDLPID